MGLISENCIFLLWIDTISSRVVKGAVFMRKRRLATPIRANRNGCFAVGHDHMQAVPVMASTDKEIVGEASQNAPQRDRSWLRKQKMTRREWLPRNRVMGDSKLEAPSFSSANEM